MRPFKRVEMLDADEYRVLKRAVASRKIAAGRVSVDDSPRSREIVVKANR